MDSESEHVAHELQEVEQKLQSFLMQKQQVQIELNEIENALSEIKDSEEVYKIVSGVMIKSSQKKIEEELQQKKKHCALKISSIEKQETSLAKSSMDLRKKMNNLI